MCAVRLVCCCARRSPGHCAERNAGNPRQRAVYDSPHHGVRVAAGGLRNGFMLTAEDIEAIQQRIVELQIEHRDLDQVIDKLSGTPDFDQLQMRRLKKRKLQLKDTITLLEMRLIPDIPA